MMVSTAKFIVVITWLCAAVQGQPHSEAPTDGRSLVIVFDTTFSMGDDLQELRAGAAFIVREMMKKESSPISNYVFVPFNDPCE